MPIRDEFQRLLDRMVAAYRAGDAAGCADCFTEDATIFSPYAPAASGRAAIDALHRDWTGDGGDTKTLRVIDADASGDLGWCLAAYSEGDKNADGTSLNILARSSDGRWLIRYCSLNSDAPPLV
ncbi:hypothetical protein DEA8626_00505 [Defluviimonas aquaemixtae]|uniref:DUF4440 domain-containing protein n=1 Tax=Albidovulum aquaemixtae TaxID=1542388 RepID=A0A2R8B2X7_9RHOB|nr:SgcJ/EcaC family oxidoreductase [Defluviimonas aquaemixtae]SPH16991.1 hypothetical protein DEA8626_00505 [Defluviimonas aquaemixtae]